jgi:hypothetical protein
MITIDMTKAKEIAKNNLRAERAPVLSALDIQFQRALESANTDLQASIAEQKQTLRDITAHETIVNAEDVNSLKSAMNTLIEQIKS